MRHPQMPNHSLKCFGVGRDVRRIDYGDDNRQIGDLRGIASVAAHDPKDCAASLLREFQSANQIRADISFETSAAHGQYEDGVFFVEVASLQPFGEYGVPSLVVRTSGEL